MSEPTSTPHIKPYRALFVMITSGAHPASTAPRSCSTTLVADWSHKARARARCACLSTSSAYERSSVARGP